MIDYHNSTNFHEFSPDGKLRIYLYLLLESITFAFDKHFFTMRGLYFITIIVIIMLGVVHSALSFKKYEHFSAEGFWFFSAGLALIFAGIANLMHYQLQLPLSFRYCIIINVLLVGFTVLLAVKVHLPTTLLVAFFSVLMTFLLLINK